MFKTTISLALVFLMVACVPPIEPPIEDPLSTMEEIKTWLVDNAGIDCAVGGNWQMEIDTILPERVVDGKTYYGYAAISSEGQIRGLYVQADCYYVTEWYDESKGWPSTRVHVYKMRVDPNNQFVYVQQCSDKYTQSKCTLEKFWLPWEANPNYETYLTLNG